MKKIFQSNVVIITSFITIIILLGAGVWYAARSEKFVAESISNMAADRERVVELRRLLSAVMDMETGQRGYIITGEPDYLEPYEQGGRNLEEIIAELEPWLNASPQLTDKWQETHRLIEKKTANLAEGIRIRRESGFNAAQAAVTDEVGKVLMDGIRKHIRDILNTVIELADQSSEQAKLSLKRNTLASTMLSAATIAMTFAGIYTLISAIRAKNESREMELDKLRAERADREKSKFLANMSHEIRTPLNAMLGFGELLEELVESDRARKYVDAIRTSGEGLLNLINDILDLSKIEAGALELAKEPVVIREFVDSIKLVFSQRALESGLDFDVSVSMDCPDYLEIDPFRVRQVLNNLVGNAFKFTEKGSIDVLFAVDPIANREDAVDLSISVQDTGRGIPRKQIKKIFKPFEQVEAEDEARGGTGLGLSISRRLAKLMGGTLTVQSEWKKGSTFTLRLPATKVAAKADATEVGESAAESLNIFSPVKILIVDDNEFNRELLAGYFHGTKHTVTFATNGREGVEQTVRQKPDVILMDIRMPVMGGHEAFQEIKSMDEFSDLPIVAVTASSLLQQELNLRRDFDGYLRKPFSRDQLVTALAPVLPKIGSIQDQEQQPEKNVFSTKGDPKKMRALIARIKTWQEKRVPDLASAMVLGDITRFAEDLLEAGEESGCQLVIDYAKDMKNHSESFELSAVETILDQFPSLINQLESMV
ncbi:MAG: CHASE3 domain-containing protein [Verrucomicrobiales bacterium]|nr:CHASE3 domain-containing protein [Verrucomicrobiales bacterium]